MLLNDSQSRCAGVARVRTQMPVSSERWIGSLDNNGVQHGFKLRHVMSVCSGHDERQRNATAVHQQMAFAPIFSPCRWDWVQRFPVPMAPSSSPRQYFAIARQCLQIRHTRQAPVSIGPQRRPLFPTPETGHGSRWHCRSAQRGALFTGTRFSEHTRSLQIQVGDPWVCVHHRSCGCKTALRPFDALESVAQHGSKTHR